MKTFRIAIDGPSGAGKSTVAKAIAKRLGFIQVDTGAMYRSVGLYIYRLGIDPSDAGKVIPHLPEINIDLGFSDEGQRIYLNGEDVSDKIRQNEISMYASKVSAIPEVRAFLLDLQRKVAHEHSVVMDGRDIGTVILPDAELKIFQTASVNERAKRRCDELAAKGESFDLAEIKKQIEERDYNDSHRAAAPCVPAEDAVIIDNSDLTIEQNVDMIEALYEMRK
ncbi:MAG: (d)CMP kinase [Clostridia bacterium]|nr:(d)CMP kinase [Clostridia bacterium]